MIAPSQAELEALHFTLGNDFTAVLAAVALLRGRVDPTDALAKTNLDTIERRTHLAWKAVEGHLRANGLDLPSEEPRHGR